MNASCRKFSRRDCMQRSSLEREKEKKREKRKNNRYRIGATDVPLATVKCYSNVTVGRRESLRCPAERIGISMRRREKKMKRGMDTTLSILTAAALQSTMIVFNTVIESVVVL